MKQLFPFLVVLAYSLGVSAQFVPVTATQVRGSSSKSRAHFLRFTLYNCGSNDPVYVSSNLVMVKKQFDLKPDPTSGNIAGSVVPNDKILCGGVASTLWTITPMKDAVTPIQPAQQYDILSNSGTFNLATAMPTNPALAPPGFQVIFGNPTLSQTINQPTGTSMIFLGTFDFTNANVLGLAPSGGGSGGPFSPGTVPCVPYYTGSANSCDIHATLDGAGNFVGNTVSAGLFSGTGAGGVIQFPCQIQPTSFNGNPLASGNAYVFCNSGTNLLDCILSSGSHCNGGGAAWGSLTAGANSASGTFSASGNSWDFTSTTIFKLRVTAACTSSAQGDLCYDPTSKMWHVWMNGADNYLVTIPVSSTVTDQDCVKFSKSGGLFNLADGGSCGGGSSAGVPMVFSSGIAVPNTATSYIAVGAYASAAFEVNSQVPVPRAGTVSNLQCRIGATLSSTQAYLLTVRHGSAAMGGITSSSTSVTCTLNSANPSGCSDTSHNFAVASDDVLDIEVDPSNNPAATTIRCSVELQ